MEIKELSFRLILLFLPGLIGYMIFERFTVHRKTEPFFFVVHSFAFGLGAYFLTWALGIGLFPYLNSWAASANGHWKFFNPNWGLGLPTKILFFEQLKVVDAKSPIEFSEIALACSVAILFALIASWGSNHKLHYRFARAFRISRKTGEMDVWGYVMNSRDDATMFVTLRDPDTDLTYDGWINAFSENQANTELLLRDVAVYRNSTSEFLYQVGAIYFKIDPKKVILEFRSVKVTELQKV